MIDDIPEALESERLDIRCPRPGDAALVHAAAVESYEEIRRWLPWAKTLPALEDFERTEREASERFRSGEDLRFNLFLKGTDTYVGGSGLHRIEWSVPKFEIGYWLRTSMTGHGYITEAVRRVNEFAFGQLGAKRVEVRMSTRNIRSRRVAERAGFPIESIMRNERREHDGSLCDTCVYAMIAPDA
jgi:RimJ/RimL family protein N-acetyltransferase